MTDETKPDAKKKRADAEAAAYAKESEWLASLPAATLASAGVCNGMSCAEIVRRVKALDA